MIVVLGRCPQQCHAADIDRFDGVGSASTGGHRLQEGIEVDNHQIDQPQFPFGKLLQVARLVATCQDAGVHIGMQSLYPAIEHLREPGQLLQGVNRDPAIS